MPSTPDLAFDLTVPLPSSDPATSGTRTVTSLDGKSSVRIDHFVVERKLGSGGMGAIYAARDTALDRPVAIKILPDELAREAEAHDRFIREARAQARLSSPHVVQIFFIGRLPAELAGAGRDSLAGRESLYFAMELVDGESLEATLARREKLDPERARRLLVQAAKGLRDAHRAGIVHRDVKPGNLLVDRGDTLRIADFGLAKPREKNLSITQEGAVMGTPYYVAPEQAIGEPVDHRADMYALGCSFYHLLAGQPPFDGPNPMAVIAQHLKVTARPVRELRPEVPPRLAEILGRLMEKEPTARYDSYDALLEALEAAAPTRAEPAGFWTRAAAASLDGVMASGLIKLLGWSGLLLYVAYVTAAHAYFGQTAAKYVLRIQVQRMEGTRLGLPRSLARAVAAAWLPFWLGSLTLWGQGLPGFEAKVNQLARLDAARNLLMPVLVGNGVVLVLLYAAGMAVAAFHPQKRALHDLVVGTRVVYRMGSQKLEILPAEAPRQRS
jgi:uncharacterized RDD family membrane protein YckC